MNRLYGLSITDLGPYRAIRCSLLMALDMREMTYGWPTEMMVKAARQGARLVEVPVSFHPNISIVSATTSTPTTTRPSEWSDWGDSWSAKGSAPSGCT